MPEPAARRSMGAFRFGFLYIGSFCGMRGFLGVGAISCIVSHERSEKPYVRNNYCSTACAHEWYGQHMKDTVPVPPTTLERVVANIGSVKSLLIHTFIFAASFLMALLGIVEWEIMLLVLTTLVSLEAIYLSLLIQITVNRHTQSLKEVEEDIEEISEDIEELGEDMEDIQEDLEEISEDIEEIQEDVEELNEEDDEPKEKPKGKKPTKAETLEQLTRDVQRVLADLEALKGTK